MARYAPDRYASYSQPSLPTKNQMTKSVRLPTDDSKGIVGFCVDDEKITHPQTDFRCPVSDLRIRGEGGYVLHSGAPRSGLRLDRKFAGMEAAERKSG